MVGIPFDAAPEKSSETDCKASRTLGVRSTPAIPVKSLSGTPQRVFLTPDAGRIMGSL
jgi:hypothetical protein